jgi:DNA polymerase delta subunit 1
MKRTNPSPVANAGGAKPGYQPKKFKNEDEEYFGGFDDDGDVMEADAMMEEKIDGLLDDGADYGTGRSNWKRGNLSANFSPTEQSIAFHWMDIDMTSGIPMSANPDGGAILGSLEGPVPIIRLYGVTRDGISVMASIHGFTPYFYVSIPQGIELSEVFLGQLRIVLDQRLREKARGDEKKLTKFVLGIEKCPGRQSLLGYHFSSARDFIKVYCAMPSLVPGLKRLFDEGISVPNTSAIIRGQTYESNVPFILRFMIDKDIYGSDWVELKAGTYSIRSSSTVSRCSIEADVFFNNLVVHPSIGLYSSIAPFRVLSFDIECQGRKGHFPEAQVDPVIQIASTVTLQGSDEPFIRNIFTLNTCLPIVGAQVICSATEEEMLLKWKAFVNAVDPDVLTGYNIMNFDIPYLLNRAKVFYIFSVLFDVVLILNNFVVIV